MAATYISRGYHAVTPYLVVKGADKLIDFLKQAFGAHVVLQMPGADGGSHNEVKIGDSKIMIGERPGEFTPVTAMLYLYVPDTDAAYNRALAMGATSIEKPNDQAYGERRAGVKDSFGNTWYMATSMSKPRPVAKKKTAKTKRRVSRR